MGNTRRRAIFYLITTAILWSLGGLFIKLIDWNPMAIAGARSGVAAIVMMAYLRRPIKGFGRNKVLGALAYASLVFLFVSANKLTTSANAILLQFTAPIWVALFSKWFLKEKVRKSDWLTIIIVMLGMILFFVGDINSGNNVGNFLAVLSGVAMAAVVISLKRQDQGSPVEMTLLGNILTFLIALPFFFISRPSLETILALLFLGVFQLGISYILYAISVKHVSALEAILIPILEPLLNPLWVFLVTKEAPGDYALIGGIIVIVAIVIRSYYQHKKGIMLQSNPG